MKKTALALVTLASLTSFAHGNLASQANSAVTAALTMVQKSEPKETLRKFKSVHAELIAHETFAVTIGYTDNSQINYVCAEDESVEPVVWGCTKK